MADSKFGAKFYASTKGPAIKFKQQKCGRAEYNAYYQRGFPSRRPMRIYAPRLNCPAPASYPALSLKPPPLKPPPYRYSRSVSVSQLVAPARRDDSAPYSFLL